MLSTILLVIAVILFIADYFVRRWSLIPAGLACFAGSFLAAGVQLAVK